MISKEQKTNQIYFTSPSKKGGWDNSKTIFVQNSVIINASSELA